MKILVITSMVFNLNVSLKPIAVIVIELPVEKCEQKMVSLNKNLPIDLDRFSSVSSKCKELAILPL